MNLSLARERVRGSAIFLIDDNVNHAVPLK
jgi:hypothetical protein